MSQFTPSNRCVIWFWAASLVVGVSSPTAGDTHETIFLAPDFPLFVRFQIRVDGIDFNQWRRNNAKQYFDILDKNGDHELNSTEFDNLSKFQFQFATATDVSNWDVAPADGRLSLTEFESCIESLMGRRIHLTATGNSARSVNLFGKIDIDGNQKLVADELEDAGLSLLRLDYDEDSSVSTLELQPYRNPLLPQTQIQSRNVEIELPLILLESPDQREAAVALMISRYAADGSTSDGVTKQELNLSDPHFVARDHDADGILNRQELRELCDTPKPRLVVEIDLVRDKAMRSRVSIQDLGSGGGIRVRQLTDSRSQLLVGASQLELRAHSSRTDSLDNRRFYMLQFRIADRDKNSYLNADEFPAVGIADARFESVDANGNGEITRDELVNYIDRDAVAAQSHPFVAMTQEGTSLFDVADANYDNRLTTRELRQLGDQARAFDRNQDGQIDISEMRRRYILRFSLGKPRVFSSDMGMTRSAGLPLPRTNRARSGPEWFRRMDRNQDGDLMWIEFLGERDVFTALDQNQDGLIDHTEADEFGGKSDD